MKKLLDALGLVDQENAEPLSFRKHYILFYAFMLLVMIIYMARLWYLQVLRGPYYRSQSEDNSIRIEDVVALRGIIYDRNGVPIVENRPAFDLMIVREHIKDLKATVEELARLCKVAPAQFFSIIKAAKGSPEFVPVCLVSDLDRDSLARIEPQLIRLPGVEIKVEPQRKYIWNGTAAQLIGYVSQITQTQLDSKRYSGYHPGEEVGKVGVDHAFDKYLHGDMGKKDIEVDAVGRKVRVLAEQPPVAGRNIWLTVDIGLQKTAESLLAGKSGAIVAVDPRDGAVLAYASSPTFDQEQFVTRLTEKEWLALSNNPDHPLLDRVCGAAYPAGSTYKPYEALGALQAGVITPTATFFCPGYLWFGGRKYHCWLKGGHGTISVERALYESCDVFFYHVGLGLGVDRIAKYVRMFGLGQKTGIGLPGEVPGLVPTSSWCRRVLGHPWYPGTTLSAAIGQGYDLVTPLQMAMGYSAIANGGKLWTPYVVKRIQGSGPNEFIETKPRLKREIPIDPKWFQLVQKALAEVVANPRGTAHRIETPLVQIAGKTGTAQVVGRAWEKRTNQSKAARLKEKEDAWFVGYAPAFDPRICVAAIVEHGGEGASGAAPLVQKVILSYLHKQQKPVPQQRT